MFNSFEAPWIVAHQAPLSMRFSRQGYWSRLPFPFYRESSLPRDWTHVYCLAGEFFTPEPLGKPKEGISMISKWASLVALLVNNLPAMQDTWVWFLGWEDPLKKGKDTHSSILTWNSKDCIVAKGRKESEFLKVPASVYFSLIQFFLLYLNFHSCSLPLSCLLFIYFYFYLTF